MNLAEIRNLAKIKCKFKLNKFDWNLVIYWNLTEIMKFGNKFDWNLVINMTEIQ
jgi:hypothetical protein